MSSGSNPSATGNSQTFKRSSALSTTAPRDHQVAPLNREFFAELIALEARIQNKSYTVETLDTLTQYYARAVECYDSQKDCISHYFIYKIQDTLATKKSLKMLMDEAIKNSAMKEAGENGQANINSEDNNKDSKLGGTKNAIPEESGDEDDDDDDEMEEDEITMMKKKKKKMGNRGSISTMKTERGKFVNIFLKIEHQKKIAQQNLYSLLTEFDNRSKNNDRVIKNEIDTQKSLFRKKLDQRKIQSFMSQTSQSTAWLDEFGDGVEDGRLLKSFDHDFLRSPYKDGSFQFGSRQDLLEPNSNGTLTMMIDTAKSKNINSRDEQESPNLSPIMKHPSEPISNDGDNEEKQPGRLLAVVKVISNPMSNDGDNEEKKPEHFEALEKIDGENEEKKPEKFETLEKIDGEYEEKEPERLEVLEQIENNNLEKELKLEADVQENSDGKPEENLENDIPDNSTQDSAPKTNSEGSEKNDEGINVVNADL
jgi:hypothetical protein